MLRVAWSARGGGVYLSLRGLVLFAGAGKQELGAVTNICSYWGCGLPLAATFAFKLHMGVKGLWWGLVAVNTLQVRVGQCTRQGLQLRGRCLAYRRHLAFKVHMGF